MFDLTLVPSCMIVAVLCPASLCPRPVEFLPYTCFISGRRSSTPDTAVQTECTYVNVSMASWYASH